jgi:hypothetical protein
MTPVSIRVPYLALALTVLSIGACNDSLSTGNAGPGEGVTNDIGATTRDEVEAALNALTLPTSIDPIGTSQSPTGFPSPGCVNPSSPTDADGDGVPNDATYQFTAPPCSFTGWRGGTLDIVGQLRIKDPTPTVPGFGYEAALTKLRTRFITGDNKLIYDVERNGTRVLSGSVSSLVLSTDLQTARSFTGKPDAAIDQQWTLTYTPLTSLQINLPVPSGTLDIAGTLDWTRGEEDYALTVSTPAPLHYNAGCTDTVQRIDAGEMQLAGDFGDLNGSVWIRWSGCGREPGFTFLATE